MHFIKRNFWLLGILALALTLRLYNLTAISLWHDEAFSALLIKYSWSEMLYRIGLDVHPPMYYVFLRFWHYLFGDSLFALRSMSVFFGVLTIWVLYAFVLEAFQSKRAALWAALLCAVNPFFVQYVTEARMYTMGAFLAVLGAYFLTKALHYHTRLYDSEKKLMPHMPDSLSNRASTLWYFLGLTLVLSMLALTHYYLLFTAAALAGYGILYYIVHHLKGFGRFKWLFLSLGLSALLFLPWLKIFLFQYRQVGAGYWIPPMDRWSVPSSLWTLILGFGHDITNITTQKLLIAFTIVMLLIIFRFLQKTQSFAKWLVLLLILAPYLGALLFYALARLKNSDSSVFLVRYFIFTAPIFSALLALWLSEMKSRILACCFLTAFVFLNLAAVHYYWKDLNLKIRPGMAGAAGFLETNVAREGSDVIFVGSSFEFFNLKYYLNRADENCLQITCKLPKPLLFTGGRLVKNMQHFEGTAILKDSDLVLDFKQQTSPGQTVWLVWTNGFGGQKPEVPATFQQVGEQQFLDVRPYIWASVYITQYRVR